MPKTNKMNGYYALRWKVLERDDFTCRYCGQSAPSAKLEVDHVLPISEGGQTTEANLVTACFSCNRGKNALKVQALAKGRLVKGPSLTWGRTNPRAESKTAHVLDTIKKRPGLSVLAIAADTNLSRGTVETFLHRLKIRGQITNRAKGHWWSVDTL